MHVGPTSTVARNAVQSHGRQATAMSDDVIIRRVRAALDGKRVLVVSNRKDAQLKKFLEEAFGVPVKWAAIPKGGGPKVRSVASSIAGGRYDVVVALTSFMKHQTGYALRQASQQSDTAYVLAGRGRPSEATLAVNRDLGLTSAPAADKPSQPDDVKRLKRRLTRR